jgi:hypothetical protein
MHYVEVKGELPKKKLFLRLLIAPVAASQVIK